MSIEALLEGVDSYTSLAEVAAGAAGTPETEAPQSTPTVPILISIEITIGLGC
ncbi:hypothetical protein [Virgisporangium aurantiacum]|uniref:Uncharacterized protein n=1 Tax=Virgisporangium aurantiacum TaxID=175570 RepID=A0A8J3ZB80_9ACTN|nr:hypothetical protein [Virgisporangium aurantiacum]GIJ58490.1 hypothetical protein Vau01_060060 [Virgisporangium aurantiacum]